MKRFFAALAVLGIVLSLLVGGVSATTETSINIDGTNDFESDEDVTGTSSTTWYFTWDSTNFYFGANNGDIDDNVATKWIHLYMDTDPHGSSGTATGVIYNTQQPILPFMADYHFRWKNDNSYTNLQTWNGSFWVDGTQTGIDKNRSGTFIEFKIPLTNLGSPGAVKVVASMINEVAGAENTFFMTPDSNAPQYDANYTHYFGFPLIAGVSPDASCNLDTYPAGTKTTGNYNTSSTWTGSSVPPSADSTNVYVASGHTLTLDESKTVKCLTILSGGTFNGGSGAKTLTIASGGRLENSSTYTKDTETVAFAGAGTTAGSVSLNNLTLAGNVSLSNAVTVNGTLTINANGVVSSNAPTYGALSTLLYNSGGGYSVSTEWGTGTSGAGVPQNVRVSTSGTSVSLTGSSARTVLGNVTIDANTTLALSSTGGGDLNVKGNWTNSGTFTHNNREVTFNGSSLQTITGETTFAYLYIPVSSGGVSLNNNITVNNRLKLGGKLTLNGSTLTIASGASLLDGSEGSSFGTSNMIIATGGGFLKRVSSGSGYNYTFPVGDASNYTPVTLSCADTIASNSYAQVKLTAGKHASMKGTDYLNRYWTMESDDTAVSCTGTFKYVEGDVNGTEGNIVPVKWSGSAWSALTSGSVDTGANTLTGGFTSFSDFSGGNWGTLAVDLATLTADATPTGVTLAWETVSEMDNAGFNIYRAGSEAGPWVKLNAALIPAMAPGASAGHTYAWTDATAAPGVVYWYQLEDVALDGTRTRHAPVQAAAGGAPNAVGLAGFGGAVALPAPLVVTTLVGALALAAAGRRRRS